MEQIRAYHSDGQLEDMTGEWDGTRYIAHGLLQLDMAQALLSNTNNTFNNPLGTGNIISYPSIAANMIYFYA